ncbi:hypothetical protein FRACYDRAFT_240953 [Fragilariopsis cylindrus CCMP1102]|uniref:Uncharacterized protein n=1 Tax=Fragilariopsis cylindrus CCMP1102 TaxID=635003 RepID=A0A1E7F8F6_9STRA|nr:hypothetical protein FRACYDRAFT_240953 [Fragilariopsis cylindrus CCMP1102]|eukprot:OEU14414.1 hypothetical protein FRACYDRAFT_240953 [Fragilariopsis cylindrus CCMP1102]
MVQRQLNQKLELKPELKQKQNWSSINNKTALKCLTLLFCAFGMIRSYDEYTMQPFIDEESVKSISNTTSRTSSTTITATTRRPASSIVSSPTCKLFPSVIAARYNNNHDHNHNNTINYRGDMTMPPLSIKDKNYTRLAFLHMRKAGGASIANFLKNVVKSNKTSFKEFLHCEGKKKCLGLHNDNDGYHRYNMEAGPNSTTSSHNENTLSRDRSGRTLYNYIKL